ncbi:MAG: hypothetical protein U9Q21_03325 [Candidatus Auribacterota bacterium]|nr:hypothetical protein [Candidatus Auribacterota bacterium]
MRIGKNKFVCDGCLKEISGGKQRFSVIIQGMAPFNGTLDGAENTDDVKEAINKLVEKLREVSSREAVEEVYVENCYDLCHLCYKKFIDDPLKVLHEKNDNK